jgi:probable rRNA maturation factor
VVAAQPSRNGAATRGSGALGEIAISLDRAREQAAAHGHPLEQELRILMLHGALHLAGFDHESDNGEMARSERRWRKRFGLPASLIERSQD